MTNQIALACNPSARALSTMDALSQITLHFGDEFVVKYLAAPPERGDRLRHGGTVWNVESVATDDSGFLVTCIPADEPTFRERRQRQMGKRQR